MRSGLILLFVIFSVVCFNSHRNLYAQETVLIKLDSLEGVDVWEIDSRNGYKRQFQIDITQPLDHDNPEGPHFKQRIYLSHKDEAAPMIFVPSGYTSYPSYKSELADTLGANQIYAAHRFYFRARPDSLDWKYLTAKQAVQDFHRIVQIFKKIYSGVWLSSGRSKDGQSALIHRRFYPDDVTATVALVAPVPIAMEDSRYDTFLESVGDENTRNKLIRYQRALLENREQILTLIQNYVNNSADTYALSADIILEFEACEYPYAFWQLTSGESTYIPEDTVTVQELYDHLEAQGGFPSYSDKWRNYNLPMYYQAYTELGWYRLIYDHIQDLLVTVPYPSYSLFFPQNVKLAYQPETMRDLLQWLQTEGNNIIYIYGGQDPITACAVELTGQTNAVKIIQPGANHYVKINNLDQEELFYNTLAKWMRINNKQINSSDK